MCCYIYASPSDYGTKIVTAFEGAVFDPEEGSSLRDGVCGLLINRKNPAVDFYFTVGDDEMDRVAMETPKFCTKCSCWCCVECYVNYSRVAPKGRDSRAATAPTPPQHRNLKSTEFSDTLISEFLRDQVFSQNQPLKWAGD
jgi:hypothetical protein